MIKRLEEVIKEYKKERNYILERASENIKNASTPEQKILKLKSVSGVIPDIPALPRSRFYHETPVSLSGTNEFVLKYKPFLNFIDQIDVYFYKETTIYDSPYSEYTELLIRLINKTIADDQGTLFQKLESVADFFDIDFGDIKKFYDDMKSKQKKNFNEIFDFKNFSKNFCSICCLFGCKIHNLSSESCFLDNCTTCICSSLFKSTKFVDESVANLNDTTISDIYKMFNYDKCLTSYYIFVEHKKCVPCDLILTKFGNSEQKIKKTITTKYKNTGKILALFNICSHPGSCNENVFCECFINNTGCDFRCLCTKCDYLFKGCFCEKGCDAKCGCYKLDKECSVYCKCISCKNNLITNSTPKSTYVYPSLIAGFGCFAGEFIKKGEFVLEYLGEIITKDEGQRRSNFYDANKCSYLFDFTFENKNAFIDANYLGNNSRFINHSQFPNIYSKIVEINKIRRICFIALRDIKVGEELFFNYNYKNEIKEMFGLVD